MNLWDIHTHRRGTEKAIFNSLDFSDIPDQHFSAGLHPWFLDENWEGKLHQIRSVSQQSPALLAIGECGFDRLRGPNNSLQKAAFRGQADLAKELEIPLILHCVRGFDLLLEYLKAEKNPPAIIWHGWNLKPELATQLLQYPVFFSFGKHLQKKESNAAGWLNLCPRDRIFLETDDSGLEISSVYQAASLILRLSVEELEQLVISNWNRISKRKIE
ncbi:Mg-dependent DNase [Algoriphagus lacus]|uniref:Mg-dependent DNase n=1 Tax=Algoriphagus lacus TaxID=2056311 RepID=A0A418PVF7_9BACT|nr:TatD family hydrolase [Algoriphagus lacus]RIW18147.1 Mg-dependent DNase [Algoriphagus lacus]